MARTQVSSLSLATALAGAVAIAGAGLTVAEAADPPAKVKCYGVALAGENDCANAAGTHSCAGQSTVDFDGGEWMLVPNGTCADMGGSLEPIEGVNANVNEEVKAEVLGS